MLPHILSHHNTSHHKSSHIISHLVLSYNVKYHHIKPLHIQWKWFEMLNASSAPTCQIVFTCPLLHKEAGLPHQTVIKSLSSIQSCKLIQVRLASFSLAGNWDRHYQQSVHRRAQQARLSACCFMKTETSPEEEGPADLTLPVLLSRHLSQTFC